MEPRLRQALEDSPVVLIQGARQCGKTTLACMVGKADGYAYRSFDDEDTRALRLWLRSFSRYPQCRGQALSMNVGVVVAA